jgi:mannose-6-phosphate isomerase-like protein (cupin superfamily)
VSGKDYYHFVKEGTGANYASKDDVADGVTLFKWNGTEEGIKDMTMHYPAHNCIEWEAGSVTPYPSTNVSFGEDTIYYVAKGNVTITVFGTMTETNTIGEGDTLWIKAGAVHSSIVPVDNQNGVIVDALYKPYDPITHLPRRLQPGPAPAPSPPSLVHGTHRFYLATDLPLPAASSRGQIHHYEWYADPYDGSKFPFTDDIDILHVWWDIGAHIGCHSHQEGALYVPSWGEICFIGEYPSDCRIAGEARWTRSGYNYDYEAAGPNGTQIIVLNAHSGPLGCSGESPLPFHV